MIDLFYDQILRSDWIVFAVVGSILLLGTEFGFRLGKRCLPEKRQAHLDQGSKLQGALLGLLGLLLGFTFAMSVGRYETRKQIVLDEANAIGTAWLRAGYLTDENRDIIRPALFGYTEARLSLAQGAEGEEKFRAQLSQSEILQARMWEAAVAEVKKNDTPAVGLFVSSLNDLIDLDGKRHAATRNHVPVSVWLLLLLVAVTACWTTGYVTGLGEAGRHALPMVVLPVLLSIVIMIIADLDNPRRGLIKVSQQSMVDLQGTLKKYQ